MSTRSNTKKCFWVVKRCRRVGLTFPPFVRRWYRQFGILSISQPYRPPWPATWIALLYVYFYSTYHIGHGTTWVDLLCACIRLQTFSTQITALDAAAYSIDAKPTIPQLLEKFTVFNVWYSLLCSQKPTTCLYPRSNSIDILTTRLTSILILSSIIV
jgi:hypothetical protein